MCTAIYTKCGQVIFTLHLCLHICVLFTNMLNCLAQAREDINKVGPSVALSLELSRTYRAKYCLVSSPLAISRCIQHTAIILVMMIMMSNVTMRWGTCPSLISSYIYWIKNINQHGGKVHYIKSITCGKGKSKGSYIMSESFIRMCMWCVCTFMPLIIKQMKPFPWSQWSHEL